MTDPAHTALPWKGTNSRTGIFSAGEPLGRNKIIAICTCDAVSRPRGENIANADFILRACNSHYELLTALEDTINVDRPDINLSTGQCRHCGRDYTGDAHELAGLCPSDDCPGNLARAALAKARGQK